MVVYCISRHCGGQQESLENMAGDKCTFFLVVFTPPSLTIKCVICVTTVTLKLQLQAFSVLLLRNKGVSVYASLGF